MERKKINKEQEQEEKEPKKQISMTVDVATRNLNHILKELKAYVNEDTVLKLSKEQIQTKIGNLFKKYPTTKNLQFDNEWYGYQLMIALNLKEKVEKDRFVRENILKLEHILPNFFEYKGLRKDLADAVYKKQEEKSEEQPEGKKEKKFKSKEELNQEIVEFGKLQRKKTIARKNSGKVPKRKRR